MPIIIVRGNLTSYSQKENDHRVIISGLKPIDIEQFSSRFPCGGFVDEQTIVFIAHPCIVLSALEVLGYRVVASSSTSVKQDFHEYCWTMRKEFSEPEPTVEDIVIPAQKKIDVPE